MDKHQKALKLFEKAGLNPTTPEELAAYRMGLKIMKQLEERKPVFGGYIGKRPGFKDKLRAAAEKIKPIFVGTIEIKLPGQIQTIPWDKFYKREVDDFVTYEITPTTSVRNNQAYLMAKVVSSFYRKPGELRSWFKDKTLLKTRSPYRCNFRIVMKADSISFYLLLPRDKAGEVLRKAEAIYDSGITIKEVPTLPQLDPEKVFCSELNYRKHDIFSLATDKDNNYPLPSLLTAVRTLEGDDVAVFDAMLEPTNRAEWHKESRQAHNLLEKGYVPDNSLNSKFFRGIHNAFEKIRYEILDLTRFTKEQKEELERWRKEEGSYREAARIREEMTPATKRKQGEEVVSVKMRIAVQSDDVGRARDANYTIANAWKDLSSDNELERTDVPQKWNKRYVEAIETRKGFSIQFKENKMSIDEAGKVFQLPGRSLIQEFPQITNQKTKEVALPDELNQPGIKAVRIGYVTERGKQKLARIPLEEFEVKDQKGEVTKIKQKAVYDAVCTSSFGQGKQGSGKTDGYGSTWAYDMVMAGFTAIIIDTADGQVLRNFVNSLPLDFPEEKIHALNYDNKAWPIPTGWEDVYGRDYAAANGGDEELAALEISERLTARFVGFINSLSKTGEFTDKMAQYVISCMRAITTRPGWAFIDLELALTSPAYREELLDRDEVKEQPDVVRDLRDLQKLAADGKTNSTLDGILSRLKVLSSTQFMANLFYQAPKLDENGKPILDLRRIMDNPEGGYGHVVVIQASYDAWQEAQATILGFFEDKINFNAFSRIDTDQANRKPVLKWIDEPHKVIKAIEGGISGTAVEFRKYRVKNLFTGHSIDQMGAAADSLLDGGAQITSYKTERLSELKRFAHNFKPYDDAEALYEALPDKWKAVNKVRLPSGKDAPAFIADMVAPPKEVKDRSYVWQDCAEKYGRHWKEVRASIQDKRSRYQELDNEWLEAQEEQKAVEAAEKKKRAKELQQAAK
ncbi:hypothetical protein HWB91_gp21 [Bacillus phage vB_BboS-125]|uniref:Uncharacterized protein n=1 Tax=Bacillus phage vB_BboS-125 TaxID=2419618 RepID=A0A3G3BWE7_9CAUD|nr:hypothetical protein HWB91_gp21 [Bacillus phage vB_BboS-125]AYP68391.1 hypothetical protein BboS125_00021 [Bacillus phage vB_BboS-125]